MFSGGKVALGHLFFCFAICISSVDKNPEIIYNKIDYIFL